MRENDEYTCIASRKFHDKGDGCRAREHDCRDKADDCRDKCDGCRSVLSRHFIGVTMNILLSLVVENVPTKAMVVELV
jgi:hypothetical protein